MFSLEGWEGKDIVPELVSDAPAALGAVSRLGAGKRMKHIETHNFFIQQYVNKKKPDEM